MASALFLTVWQWHHSAALGRSALSVKDDIEYIHAQYSLSPAFIPLYYVYDSYHIPIEDWASILKPGEYYTMLGYTLGYAQQRTTMMAVLNRWQGHYPWHGIGWDILGPVAGWKPRS